MGLHFRGSNLLDWGIRAPSSDLRWELPRNPTPLGIPIISQGLCSCPGAALTGMVSLLRHPSGAVLRGGGTGKLLAKARECRSPLCTWFCVECSPQPCPLQPERGKRFLLPSACSAGLEPVSWGRKGIQGGLPPAGMTEPYLQEDGSSSSPMPWQRPGKPAGVPAGTLLHSPGCNCQSFV